MNFIQRVFVKKKNPKRAACASLVEREKKGFEVALKRWKRKTIVSEEVSSILFNVASDIINYNDVTYENSEQEVED